jgi:beta-1,4-mannooligosaccharide/beta-1,4-mannosyl-N-acetylglucosamine phosphorylase
LALTHVVDLDPSRRWGWEGNWNKRYTIALALLDLRDPSRVIGLSRQPLMVPEPPHEYETRGYRDYVLFPGGTILEEDGAVKIYYGAADTVEALAFAHVDDLLAMCAPV